MSSGGASSNATTGAPAPAAGKMNGARASSASTAAASSAAPTTPAAAASQANGLPSGDSLSKSPSKRVRRKAAPAAVQQDAPVASASPTGPASAVAAPVTLTLAQQQQASVAAKAPAKPVAASAPSAPAASVAATVAVRPAATRLSASMLPLGPHADSKRQLACSSLATAGAQASLFISWLRDLHAMPRDERPRTARVLELGAGGNQGRNVWMFLVALAQRAPELAAIFGGGDRACAASASAPTASPLSLLAPFAASFSYLLTDPSQQNLDNLRQHPQLAPFFEAGLLDIALLDPTAPAASAVANAAPFKAGQQPHPQMELYLQHSSMLLTSLDSRTPLLCLCNEQMAVGPVGKSKAGAPGVSSRWKFDAFCFEPTASVAALKELTVSVQPAAAGEKYPVVEWSSSAIADLSTYYPQREFNQVLSRYLAGLTSAQFPSSPAASHVSQQPLFIDSLPKKANAASSASAAASSVASSSSSAAATTVATPYHTFTLPVTAFQLVQSLRRFAGGPLLLLIAERGLVELTTLPNQRPSVGFTMPTAASPTAHAVQPSLLNLHALALLTREMGGFMLAPTDRASLGVKVTAFGFHAPEEASSSVVLTPVPDRNATPTKSALKPASPQPAVAAADSPVAAAVEADATTNGSASPRKVVKFVGLSWKERRALAKAEKLLASEGALHSQSPQLDVQPPLNTLAAFRAHFDRRSPFDASVINHLCSAALPKPAPVPAVAPVAGAIGTAVAAPAPPVSRSVSSHHASGLRLTDALALLALADYEVDVWQRLKSLFLAPMPTSTDASTQGRRSAASAAPVAASAAIAVSPAAAGSPTEHDMFQAFARVWSGYFALPIDIYGPVGASGNLDLAFEFGSFFCIRRRHRAAVACYSRSQTLFGQHAVTQFNIGQCYIKLRCFAPARAHLEQAIQLDPKYAQARQWLQWVETQVGSAEDVSLDEASEAAALQQAFDQPFFEPIGEAEEEPEPQQAEASAMPPVGRKTIQEEAKSVLAAAQSKQTKAEKKAASKDVAPVAAPASSTPIAVAVPAAATADAVASSAVASDSSIAASVDSSATAQAKTEKTCSRRERENERKQAKRAAAAAASGAIEQPAAITTPLPSAAAPAPVVPAVAVGGAPASVPAPSPSASPSLQSFLKPSMGASWAEMDDEESGPQPSPRHLNGTGKAPGKGRKRSAKPKPTHAANGVAATTPKQQ